MILQTAKKTVRTLLPGVLLLVLSGSMVLAKTAVVVHCDNPIDDISLGELKRVYLGKSTSFVTGRPIVLAENNPLAAVFYENVAEMSLKRFRKYWMKVVFEGQYATPPVVFEHSSDLKEFVGRQEFAIGFLDFADVDSTVKVLTIDGISPESPEYPLKDEAEEEVDKE